MLGDFNSWVEFLRAETDDLETLPRRMLKAGKIDVQKRLSKEILKFCNRNFVGMNQAKLSALFEDIKVHRGLEMPLDEFESNFAKVKPTVLRGQPTHCTIEISLWGLQFKFPEDMLAKDVIEALTLNRRAEETLNIHKGQSHQSVKAAKSEIATAIRQSEFGARMCVLACFNLVETFANGIAWDFSRNVQNIESLSKNRKKLIQDGTIRDKLLKYPETVAGTALWSDQDEPLKSFLEQVKPYRNSLVHPSPFSVPGRYGGYDKLEHLYRIDSDKAEQAAKVSVDLIIVMLKHVCGTHESPPAWLQNLVDGISLDPDFDAWTKPTSTTAGNSETAAN
ncbi:MAG: hypothetical protein O2967_07030 [Proteobacteria bacterium]|nr:hypothetical protein [Pseudomonadota bacterium]